MIQCAVRCAEVATKAVNGGEPSDDAKYRLVTPELEAFRQKRLQLKNAFREAAGKNWTLDKYAMENVYYDLKRADGDASLAEWDLIEKGGALAALMEDDEWCYVNLNLYLERRKVVAVLKRVMKQKFRKVAVEERQEKVENSLKKIDGNYERIRRLEERQNKAYIRVKRTLERSRPTKRRFQRSDDDDDE